MAAGPLHPDGSDLEEGFAHGTVGPDIGDADLDSDSDRYGTGENAAAGRDILGADGADIDTDHIESLPPEEDDDEPARRH